MTSLFFYGTLRYVPLLSIVLGREADAIAMRPAQLEGHVVRAVDEQSFPTLVMAEGNADGLLVEGVNEEDLARIAFYEGGFGYELRAVTVETEAGPAQAEVFFSRDERWIPAGDWDPDGWVSDWGAMTCHAAREVMAYWGSKTAEEVATMYPMIRSRASARVNAVARNDGYSPSGFSIADTRLTKARRAYADYFALDEFDLSFRRYGGGQSETVRRAVFIATDAVIVLPYDPVRDRVLLVEQFRSGPYGRGDERPWQLEPIAGRLDGGESPEVTARREAEEEAGLQLGELCEVANCYASPGCSTEFYNIYIGLADLPDSVVGVGGLESEAEDIRSYLFGFDELMTMVDKGQAMNAPLVLVALWLARHRERLRKTA